MKYIAVLLVIVVIYYLVKINKNKEEPKTAKTYYSPNKSSIVTATRSKPTRMKDESEDVLLNAYIASNLLDTSSDDDRSYSRNDYRDYSSDNDYSRSSSYSSSYGGDSSSSSSSSYSDSSSSSLSSSSD